MIEGPIENEGPDDIQPANQNGEDIVYDLAEFEEDLDPQPPIEGGLLIPPLNIAPLNPILANPEGNDAINPNPVQLSPLAMLPPNSNNSIGSNNNGENQEDVANNSA